MVDPLGQAGSPRGYSPRTGRNARPTEGATERSGGVPACPTGVNTPAPRCSALGNTALGGEATPRPCVGLVEGIG